MDITRVHYDGAKVQFGIQHSVGKTSVTASIDGKDPPRAEFVKALEELRPFVPKLCRPILVGKLFEERATITGITISRKNEDEPGYVITAKCPVDGVNTPLNIATPYLARASEGSGEFRYRENLFRALDTVEEEAILYLRSHQPSLDLFAGENGRRTPPPPTPIEQEAARAAAEAAPDEAPSAEPGTDLRAGAERALFAALPLLPGITRGADISDDDLALFIAEAWDDVEFQADGRTYAGLFRYEPEDGGAGCWCFLLGERDPRFYYDIAAPDEFDATAAIPTIAGLDLIAAARRVYFREELEQMPAVEAATVPSGGRPDLPPGSDEDPVHLYIRETRPAATPGLGLTDDVVMQCLHTALVPDTEIARTWLAASREGRTDEGLANLLHGVVAHVTKGASQHRGSEAIGTTQNELPVEFVEWSILTGPPLQFIAGNSKRKSSRRVLQGAELQEAVRALLHVRRPVEEETVAEAEIVAAAAGATTGADSLFAE